MIYLQTAAFAVVVAFVAAGAHYMVQRRVSPDLLAQQNDVAGYIYSAIAVTYAVVLGFVVVVAWQRYGEVQNYVSLEGAAVFDLYHTAAALPQPLRSRVRMQLRTYTEDVVGKEWPEMARGVRPLSAADEVETVAREIETFQPVGIGQQDVHQVAMQEVLHVLDARRRRVLVNEHSVPPTLWFALIAGASATVGFSFFFGVRNRVVQLLMTGILAALIAVMFVAIREFDAPFRGANAIPPTGWHYFESRMKVLGS